MSDEIDRAQQREAEIRDDALQAQQRRAAAMCYGESARWCQVCDELIPLARRRAVPGVQTCVACQTDLERGLVHG